LLAFTLGAEELCVVDIMVVHFRGQLAHLSAKEFLKLKSQEGSYPCMIRSADRAPFDVLGRI